jgi:hypothetical protein
LIINVFTAYFLLIGGFTAAIRNKRSSLLAILRSRCDLPCAIRILALFFVPNGDHFLTVKFFHVVRVYPFILTL